MKERTELTRQEKAEAILLAIAKLCAEDKSITLETDWNEFGAATIVMDGAHTHIGGSYFGESEDDRFTVFVHGLHGQLCEGKGLSWVRREANLPTIEEMSGSIDFGPRSKDDTHD
jgi:hypothetical protein